MLIYPTLKMTPIRGLTGFGGGATGSLVSGTSSLFPFSSFEFTQAGAGKRDGRTRSEFLAHSDYDTSTYSWLSDTNFFDVTTSDGIYPVGIQLFTVPATATYRIEARGGHGGSIEAQYSPGTLSAFTGGIGARIQGDFDLTEGEKLEILVGNEGGDVYEYGGGFGGAPGGGGSFVIKQRTDGVYSSSDILIIAGGGGGAEMGGRNTSDHGGNGQPSTVTGGAGQNSSQTHGFGSYGSDAPSGISGNYGTRAHGGINGYGGGGAMGGGGGGFYDRGGYGNNSAGSQGNGYVNGSNYSASERARGGINDTGDNAVVPNGGFGGGAGAQHNTGYAGGAGGYSGGGGGHYGTNAVYSGQGQGNGGGGGSFNSGSNKVETTFTQANHPNTLTGYESFVKITLL